MKFYKLKAIQETDYNKLVTKKKEEQQSAKDLVSQILTKKKDHNLPKQNRNHGKSLNLTSIHKEGARPTEFTSKELRRDYMNICDIEGARPSIMKGYGGVMKQYEQPFSLSKISQLPYAGVSKKDNHVENDLFKMSNEQNSAADFIEFMRKKKGNRDNKPAGIINMGFRRNAKKFKYQYQPPYGYGGNFSTGVKKCPYDRNICTSGLRQNSYNLLGQASRDHNSHSRSRLGNKILKPPTALDPNLDIQQISDFIDPKVRHHSSSKKKIELIPTLEQTSSLQRKKKSAPRMIN